jgi:hypothetical protein
MLFAARTTTALPMNTMIAGGTDGRRADTERFRNLGVRPSACVNKPYRGPLSLRERQQCGDQRGFDVGDAKGRRRGQPGLATPTGPRLPDAEEVAGRVVQRSHLGPVLPGESECLGDAALLCQIDAPATDQRAPQPGFDRTDELLENVPLFSCTHARPLHR